MRRETDYFGIIRIFKGKNAAITKQRSAGAIKRVALGFRVLEFYEMKKELIYL